MIKNIFEWYEENSVRKYPLAFDTDDIIPDSFIVDALVYGTSASLQITEIALLEEGLEVTIDGELECLFDYEVNEPYKPIPVMFNNQERGFIVFGKGVFEARSIFAEAFIPTNADLLPTSIFHIENTVTSISSTAGGQSSVFGDVSLVAGNAVHITRVSDGFLFSIFDDVKECGDTKTPCIKTVNGIMPDDNGNITVDASDILYLQPINNGLQLQTPLDESTVCLERFPDNIKGEDGDPGPIGPKGPIGDCLVMPERSCTCETCETCDTCEAGDAGGCDPADFEPCDQCDTCDSAGNFDLAPPNITITSGILIRDHFMSWHEQENWAKTVSVTRENPDRAWNAYWDYENNVSFGLMEMRSGSYSPDLDDVHILRVSNVKVDFGNPGGAEDFTFYIIKSRRLKDWTHTYTVSGASRSWSDYVIRKERLTNRSSEIEDTPTWFPDVNEFSFGGPLPRPNQPTISFELPCPESDDLSEYFCDDDGRSFIFYSTYENVDEFGTDRMEKKVKLLYLDTTEVFDVEDINPESPGTLPQGVLLNVTTFEKSNSFPLFFGIHNRDVERLDGATDIDFNGDTHYEQWNLHCKRIEAISLRCHDIGSTEVFNTGPNFDTVVAGKTPISGPYKDTDLNSIKLEVYEEVFTEEWYTPNCLVCDSDDINEGFGG